MMNKLTNKVWQFLPVLLIGLPLTGCFSDRSPDDTISIERDFPISSAGEVAPSDVLPSDGSDQERVENVPNSEVLSTDDSSLPTYEAQPGPDLEKCLQAEQNKKGAAGQQELDAMLQEIGQLEKCSEAQIQYGEEEGARYQAYLDELSQLCNQADNEAACTEWSSRMDKQDAHMDRILEQQRLNNARLNGSN